MINSKLLPENIRRCMAKETRKELGKTAMTHEEANAKQDAESERELQNQLCDLLRLRGIEFCRPSMHRRSTIRTGWPDITFCIGGRGCVWEVKTEIGKLTTEQINLANRLMSPPNNWRYEIIRSVRSALNFLDAIEP